MKDIHGWTLIELMVTLAVFSLLVSIALPSFSQLLDRHTQHVALNMLQHLSYYTRTEAVRRNKIYTLCASDDLINCHGEWNNQLIVFSDPNKNEQVDSGEVLFRVHQFDDNTPCIVWNRTNRQYVQFKPSGASNGTAGHFKFCDDVNTQYQHRVVISLNGRISRQQH